MNTDHDSQGLAMQSNILLFITSPEEINYSKNTSEVRIQGDNNPPVYHTQIQFNLWTLLLTDVSIYGVQKQDKIQTQNHGTTESKSSQEIGIAWSILSDAGKKLFPASCTMLLDYYYFHSANSALGLLYSNPPVEDAINVSHETYTSRNTYIHSKLCRYWRDNVETSHRIICRQRRTKDRAAVSWPVTQAGRQVLKSDCWPLRIPPISPSRRRQWHAAKHQQSSHARLLITSPHFCTAQQRSRQSHRSFVLQSRCGSRRDV